MKFIKDLEKFGQNTFKKLTRFPFEIEHDNFKYFIKT